MKQKLIIFVVSKCLKVEKIKSIPGEFDFYLFNFKGFYMGKKVNFIRVLSKQYVFKKNEYYGFFAQAIGHQEDMLIVRFIAERKFNSIF